MLAQKGRVESARQLAQLVDPLSEIVLGRGRGALGRSAGSLLELRAGHAELERHRDELLLGAVVEIALESPALGVADLHEFGARSRQALAGVGVGQRLADEVREVA